MDKRSLLFVFLLSIAFFGVHTWFDAKNAETKQKEISKAAEELENEVRSRTAPIEQLPVASFFADFEGKQKIATGILTGNFFLTLSENMPSSGYVSSGNQRIPVQFISGEKGGPVLYSRGESSQFKIATLPDASPADLQLLTLGQETKVIVGEQRGNSFTLPYHFLEEKAIALLNVGTEYLPVGIYEPENKKIKTFQDFVGIKQFTAQVTPVQTNRGEEFYVLENEYQQLVFSTRGGALAEINLPLRSETNQNSIVKEIDFDREILAHSPQNAHFPLHPYHTATGGMQQKGSLGGYYPLLRRPIINTNGEQVSEFPPQYYALNIVGDMPEIASLNYQVTRFEPNLIQFTSTSGQRKIVKTFSIPQERNGPYCFQLDMQIEGDTRNLWLTSGIPDVEIVGGSYAPLLRIQVTKNNVHEVDTIDLPKKEVIQVPHVQPNWISNNNGFLGIITDPLEKLNPGYKTEFVLGSLLPTRLTLVDPGYRLYPAADYPGYATYLPIKPGNLSYRIFAGPFDEGLLKKLDSLFDNPLTSYNPNYASAQSIQGWFSFISAPFSKFLFFLMEIFYAVTRSWAAAIILLTIALRLMMYPLNAWSIKSSLKMQTVAPKVKLIQEKYKKDPQRARLEILSLYKESGGNPMTGCIPQLLQLPFLMGMFYLLKSSFPLRGAPFIPGWIDDLAAPDILFSWSQPIWFVGNEFHLLPIFMGLTMYLQHKLTVKTPKDGEPISDAEKQKQTMGLMMSVVFVLLFYNFPSGLNLYFMFSTLLGILQQWWVMKKIRPV
ncbi:MAG TPA: membrane protein insertase YidC [Chlamydiales bacterium]|nr:membrane protein insertase YidC [Chlamydiales bacterium]